MKNWMPALVVVMEPKFVVRISCAMVNQAGARIVLNLECVVPGPDVVPASVEAGRRFSANENRPDTIRDNNSWKVCAS